MHTLTSIPIPSVAPGATRRPLHIKRSKHSMLALSAEDKAALIPKPAALGATHAPRVLELAAQPPLLARVALDALTELG